MSLQQKTKTKTLLRIFTGTVGAQKITRFMTVRGVMVCYHFRTPQKTRLEKELFQLKFVAELDLPSEHNIGKQLLVIKYQNNYW